MRSLAGEEPVAEPAVARVGGQGAVSVDLRHGSRQDGHERPVLHLLPRHTKVIRLVLCSKSWISRLPRFGLDSVVFSVVLFELMIFLMSIG